VLIKMQHIQMEWDNIWMYSRSYEYTENLCTGKFTPEG
jgi:hypothetical protein